MVKLLEPGQIDVETEDVEAVLIADEERRMATAGRVSAGQRAPDLSDGGSINGVNVRTMQADGHLQDRKAPGKGRAAARMAWTWNGTESVLPLAWQPDGKSHDGAGRYLRKRHCLCCHSGGFRGRCANCVNNNCSQCAGGTDTQTPHTLGNGKVIKGWLIPNFYLHKEDVPFPTHFYGTIDCFLPFCPRSGKLGFLTQEAMRMHARTRHKMEYQAHLESLAAERNDELDSLRRRLDMLTIGPRPAEAEVARDAPPKPARRRRPSPEGSAVGTPERPLYVKGQ